MLLHYMLNVLNIYEVGVTALKKFQLRDRVFLKVSFFMTQKLFAPLVHFTSSILMLFFPVDEYYAFSKDNLRCTLFLHVSNAFFELFIDYISFY